MAELGGEREVSCRRFTAHPKVEAILPATTRIVDQTRRPVPSSGSDPMFDHGRDAPCGAMRRWIAMAGLILLVPGLAACSRDHYRRQADREVQCLIESGASDPRWPLKDYTINTDKRSRYFDPHDPDCPPMPPDDPVSHQLMHCVDGKHGWKHWDKYGKTSQVESPNWKAFLPLSEDGYLVLDRTAAMQLALIHSREYRQEVEDLYLSALNVTFERFQFDVQFFGGNDTFFTTTGPLGGDVSSSSQLSNDATLSARKNLAAGGELLAGVANSIVWEFSGSDGYRVSTPLTFALTQPLLRAAGRAVAMENLTQAERNLLANIRQMERFRRGFHAAIVFGRSGVVGPTPGSVGLPSVSGSFTSRASGFVGLLTTEVNIRNLENNVESTRDSLSLMEANFDAGQVQLDQVQRIRQQLYSAQSRLLERRAGYENQLDSYKLTLGLPPDLKVRIEDPMLKQFNLIDPELTAVEEDLDRLLEVFRDEDTHPTVALDQYDRLLPIRDRCAAQIKMIENDLVLLDQALPRREVNLRMLASRPEARNREIDPETFSIEDLHRRRAEMIDNLKTTTKNLEGTFAALEAIARTRQADAANPGIVSTEARGALVDLLTLLKDQLLEMSLLEAKIRLDTVSLVPIDITAERALEIAREHRRDWMNARAALVDQWRQIEIIANALRSNLDLVVNWTADPVSDNFGAPSNYTQGRLSFGLQFDAPLTRLAERNAYRRALINYQRMKRDYYAFEDRIQQSLRDAERVIRLSQLNFELQRAGLFVAITRVDLERLKLTKPVQGRGGAAMSSTAAIDVLNALNDLLSASDTFLAAWVDYEAQRLNLDLDMGTMELDDRGMWIDPGPIMETGPAPSIEVETLPPVAPSPVPPAPATEPAPPMAQAAPPAPQPLPPARIAYEPVRSVQAQ